MEILRINASKLKITLTRAECAAYNIKESGGEFDSSRIRSALGDILEEAGAKDFYVGSEKLLVQLYPAKEGGAELFVTKLAEVGERERRAVARSGNLTTYTKSRAHFAFSELDHARRAARALLGRVGRSDLYSDMNGGYVLSLDENKLAGMSDCDLLCEFGTRMQAPTGRLSPEWYDLVYEGDAIERLSAQ